MFSNAAYMHLPVHTLLPMQMFCEVQGGKCLFCPSLLIKVRVKMQLCSGCRVLSCTGVTVIWYPLTKHSCCATSALLGNPHIQGEEFSSKFLGFRYSYEFCQDGFPFHDEIHRGVPNHWGVPTRTPAYTLVWRCHPFAQQRGSVIVSWYPL